MLNSNDKRTKDDAGDLRAGGTKVLSRTTLSNLGKARTSSSLKVDHSKDKELINSGLHKLVSSFNTVNKVGSKTSKIISKKNSELKTDALEKPINSHIVLTKQASIDKYTMTDFDGDERQLCIETTRLNQSPYRDLQWTDPRLLKKYSLVKQPYKKSLTIPYVSKSECSAVEENCSEDDAELLYSENTHLLFKCLYYFCTASVFFVGSMCGITLITLILWKMLDENLLTFYLSSHKSGFVGRGLIRGLMGAIFSLCGSVIERVMRLLTISRSEVFASENPQVPTHAWFNMW